MKTMLRHSAFWLTLACAGGIFAFQIFRYAAFTVDDAYISFRYAENFANGGGLVFNQGERVEGYTNFLWVLLLALWKKCGGDIEMASQVFGVTCSAVTLLMTFGLSWQISSAKRGDTAIFASLAAIFLATSPSVGLWAVAGLETPLFMCLLTGAVWRHLHEERAERVPLSALLFGLLALTRPEGTLFFVLTLFHQIAHRFWASWKQENWPRILLSIGLFAAIIAPHFLWRWHYYGRLFPNTFYAKVSGAGLRLSGVKYAYEFFLTHGGVTFFLICATLLVLKRFREYWVSYLLLLFGVSTAYIVYVGGDWMPSFRFFAPLLPLYFLCAQEGLREFYALIRPFHRQIAAAATAAAAFVFWGNLLYLLYVTPPIDTRQDGHYVLGHVLRQHAAPGDLLAAIDIGAMAYFSGLRTLDYFGLTDAHIASAAPQDYRFERAYFGHQTLRLKSDVAYVFAQRPRFIEVNTINNPPSAAEAIPLDPYADLLIRHPAFQQHYAPCYHAGGSTLFKRVQ